MSEVTVACKVPFSDFAKTCELISNADGRDKKRHYVIQFLTKWRKCHEKTHGNDENTTDSFYPAMRLFLPMFDKDRSAYGIKEGVLAKLYIKLLCLHKDSQDAKKLLNYRAPQSARADAGDFANVAYYVIKSRIREEGTMSIADVNQSLDEIALANAEKRRSDVEDTIMRMIKKLSPESQKWLIRIILKSLKLGQNETTLFNIFHPDARDLYDVSNSLLRVCTTLRDPKVRLHEIEISLFSPFRPMLADTAHPEKVDNIMKNRKFYVETKHDGERMQLHTDGTKFMYFSRNGYDFTSSFGGSASEGPLTRYISSCFKGDVRNCILDGEMVGYNIQTEMIGSKGENFDVKYLSDDTEYQPCYCVFDVVYLNGKVLTSVPLKERLQVLSNLFTPIEGRIHFTTRSEISTKQEAIKALNDAIDNREEGVVVKDPISVYKPNARKAGWYKIKPEYIDDLMDQLDLIIIGGYFGEGRRSGLISQFLLGVAVDPEHSDEHPKLFHSVARVGSGYTQQELNELCKKLNSHWNPYDRRYPPEKIVTGSGQKERPDVWIEPCNSQIVQIKATEINKSEKFMTGYTLRFPRVEKVRYDKNWYECMTVEEFTKLRMQSQGKLASRHMSSEGEPSSKKARISIREKPTLSSQFTGVDPSSITKITNSFAPKEFVVINGSKEKPKHDLETLIIERGGNVVQNPGPNTYCVIAHTLTQKVQNKMTGKYNIVKADWLLSCVEENRLLPWTPSCMWHMSEKTASELSESFDRFGDSFTEPTDEEKLKIVFGGITNNNNMLTCEDIRNLENDYFPNTSPIGLFRPCLAFFDDSCSKLSQLTFAFYGGSQCDTITNKVSHVITNTSNSLKIRDLQTTNRNRSRKFHLVTPNWIDNCLKKKVLLSEKHYHPECN